MSAQGQMHNKAVSNNNKCWTSNDTTDGGQVTAKQLAVKAQLNEQ
jgi:hypothetical protein